MRSGYDWTDRIITWKTIVVIYVAFAVMFAGLMVLASEFSVVASENANPAEFTQQETDAYIYLTANEQDLVDCPLCR